MAQNIIPDPSFEDWDDNASTLADYLGELYDWMSVNGSPDYHHQDHPPGSSVFSLEDCPLGTGSNVCGVPYEGSEVLGIYKANGVNGTKEWAGATLLEPMVVDQCYIVSFNIQKEHSFFPLIR